MYNLLQRLKCLPVIKSFTDPLANISLCTMIFVKPQFVQEFSDDFEKSRHFMEITYMNK